MKSTIFTLISTIQKLTTFILLTLSFISFCLESYQPIRPLTFHTDILMYTPPLVNRIPCIQVAISENFAKMVNIVMVNLMSIGLGLVYMVSNCDVVLG